MNTPHGIIRIRISALIALFALGWGAAATAETEQETLIKDARATVEDMMQDPAMAWVHTHLKNAKGVLIVPSLTKTAAEWGGSGGRGVLLLRYPKTGHWSQPAFYAMSSVSFEVQAGRQVSAVVMLVNSRKGSDSLLHSWVKLGADASVAAGPERAGAQAATADILSYARLNEAFAGVSLDGVVLKASDDWARAYYGRAVRPADILLRGSVKNPQAGELQQTLAIAATCGGKPEMPETELLRGGRKCPPSEEHTRGRRN